jgi:pyruvate/2-oxoglutarate/acetoin dehydrogenase E1 component
MTTVAEPARNAAPTPKAAPKETAESDLTYREAITAAMADEMETDESVVLMGEDVGAEGGVFKTNAGLLERFGPKRVINTPICENGFVGVALGMSLMGMRPVVEIMFSDFLPTAGDAIVNELPKYRFMSGGKCAVPVTIRSISGGTGRFGTQHSATGESWFIGLPGLRVVTASSPGAAYELLRAAIRDPNPVLFHEHKGLYGRKGPVRRGAVAELGRAAIVRDGRDVTIVGTLLMVERALKAAETLAGEGIEAEVIDLRWLRPMDVETVSKSVDRTGRLVVAEEQVHHAGWGATLISELTMRGVGWERPPIAVSLPYDVPIPYSPPLEDAIIPSAERIAEAARSAVTR